MVPSWQDMPRERFLFAFMTDAIEFDPLTRQARPFRAGKESTDAVGVLRHAQ